MAAKARGRQRRRRGRKASRSRWWLAVGGVLLLALVVGGMLLYRGSSAPVGSAGNGASGTGSGPPAPDFTVTTLDGGTFTLSAQRGKPVILFVMAYWCGTCVPEAKALARLHRRYGDRVTIVALDVDPSSTPERLQAFREQVGTPDYVWAFDRGNRVAQAYRVRSLVTTFIINQAGEIVYSDAYPTPYETLEAQIRQLLG